MGPDPQQAQAGGGGLGDWTAADMQAATKVAPDTGPCSLPGSPLRAAFWPHPGLGLGPEGDTAHTQLWDAGRPPPRAQALQMHQEGRSKPGQALLDACTASGGRERDPRTL